MLVETHNMTPESIAAMSPNERLQVYCGLDNCVTFEVLEALQRLPSSQSIIYNFERALQGPILEMMLGGFLIDETERQFAIQKLRKRLARLEYILNSYSDAVWGKPLNPRSNPQLKDFFYGTMHLPEVWISEKGQRKLSFKREALEKLEAYLYAMPIVGCIMEIRETAKQLETLLTEVDYDGRMRSSFNIAGTETGRLSSSSNAFGTGGNLQNITDELRIIYIADSGMKMCVIDLEQAEAREVGWICGILFGDWRYLDACESGDLHTMNARLIWPQMPWTGDLKADRKLAEAPFYRDIFSFRDMSKRGGHGCLTNDHQVLTRDGWVPISDKPQEILTWTDSKSEFAEVSNWTDHLYTGELQDFDGNSISARMTHDHRVPYRSDTRSLVKDAPADCGPGRFMPLGGNYVGGTVAVPARLIAAFMADGHQKTPNRMEFHFHKERKKERLQQLCEMYGFIVEERGDKMFVHGSLQKIPDWTMLNWTKECITAFVDELKYWDGTQSPKGTVSISSTSRKDLSLFQTLGRISGTGGKIVGPYISGFGSTVWRLHQNNRQWATGKSVEWTKKYIEDERVFCPTVPSGWFYVRRNGKIFVTGNTSYYGQAFTIARFLKVPVKLIVDFQAAFLAAYPSFPLWWQWTAQQIQTKQTLTTFFGRERQFFGRPGDDATLREAIAFQGQSPTADRTNYGMLQHWHHFRQDTQLLAQTHDSITFQYKEHLENEIIPVALRLMEIPLFYKERKFIVPGEAKVGWNWAKHHDESKPISESNRLNPNGLKKWSSTKPDTRQRLIGLARPL